MTTQTPAVMAATPAPATTKPAVVGQTVYFYAAPKYLGGMTRIDDAEPFAAIVAYVHSDRLVNLLAIDHIGQTFPCESVALFQGDDKDDKTALGHCEIKAPEPRNTVTVSGSAGQPIALDLGSEIPSDVTLASAKIKFTVPVGETYTFASKAANLSQAFTAAAKPQVFTLASDQVGAIADLTLTTTTEHDVLLAVTAVEGVKSQTVGVVKASRTYRFNESVAFVPYEPAAEPAASLASQSSPSATPMPPPSIAPAVGATPAA